MRYLLTLGLLLVVACSTSLAANFCSGDGTTSCAVDADCSGVGGYCGFQIVLLVKTTALADLSTAKTTKISEGFKENTTNEEFALELVRLGLATFVQVDAQALGRQAAQTAISTHVSAATANFPTTMRQAVCGDGELDSTAGEQCDDGESNSATAPDACRPGQCVPAYCGDGVVDTGEVCDGTPGCLDDCSGT